MATFFKYPVRFAILTLCLFITSHLSAQTFSLKGGSHRGAIQWEQSFDNKAWTNVVNGNTTNIETKPDKTTYYRAKITEIGCAPLYSDVKAALVEDELVVGAKLIKGNLKLPDGAAAKFKDLIIYSLLDTGYVKTDGSFEVLVGDSSMEQMLYALNDQGEAVLFGYYTSKEENYELSAASTGLSLLIMYPYAKSVSVEEKEALLEKYKKESEYLQLVLRMETALKDGRSTIGNEEKRLLFALINKDFNKFRLKVSRSIQGENMILGNEDVKDNDEITRTISGSTFTLTNNKNFSYVGGIYKNGERLHTFLLPGEMITTTKTVRDMMNMLKPTDTHIPSYSTKLGFDVRDWMKEPGQYEIRMRNGSNDDQSYEGSRASTNNWYEGYTAVAINVVPNFIGGFPKKCLTSIMLAAAKNIVNTNNFNNDKDLIYDLILPSLKEAIEFADVKQCGREIASAPLKAAFKSIMFAYDAYQEWPSYSYFLRWDDDSDEKDLCQFVTKEMQTMSCFVIIPAVGSSIKPAYYTGDVVDLKVWSIENNKYYPYTNEFVENAPFTWLTTSGSAFVENSLNYTTQTDAKGQNTSKWYMPCKEESENGVIVSFLGKDFNPQDHIFKTKAFNPKPEVWNVRGNNQIGEPGKRLKENLDISVKDLLDGKPMLIDLFKIDWAIKEGTGKIESTTSQQPALVSSFAWTLGPETGKQSATATVYVKNECLKWEILGSPIEYVANMGIDTVSILIVHGKWRVFEGTDVEGDTLGKTTEHEYYDGVCSVDVDYSTRTDSSSIQFFTDSNSVWEEHEFIVGNYITNDCQVISGAHTTVYKWKWEYVPAIQAVRFYVFDPDDKEHIEFFDLKIVSITKTELVLQRLYGDGSPSNSITKWK